ncbi:MAG: type II toxin-antitoxin system Phd/YefM family antitoxin [Bacteroidetes bacterium]|nr:type II toxin-antitoxin system Phd/YefM family antitoxin [Bacteroidota bacterium]
MITYVTTQEARRDILMCVERVQENERIILTRCRVPVLAMVPLSDLEQLQDMELLVEQIDREREERTS